MKIFRWGHGLFVPLFCAWAHGNRISAQEPCPVVTDEKPVKREVGLNVFAWVDWNTGQFVVAKGYTSFGNGVFYAVHSRRNVVRVGIDYFHYRYTEGSKPDQRAFYPWYDYAEGNSTVLDGHLGYQRTFTTGWFQPYVGANLHLRFMQRSGTYEGVSDIPPYEYSGTEGWHSTQIGFAPTLGLRVRLGDHIHFYGESSCLLATAWTTNEGDARTVRDGLFLLNPIRAIGISYLF